MDAAFDKLRELKPNVLNVYSVMSQAFNLLEQGEIRMLAGNFSSYALPRKAAGAPGRFGGTERRHLAMPSASVWSKTARIQRRHKPTSTRMLGAELQGKVAEFSASLPANTTVPASASTPKGVEVFSPDWAFVAKNRKEWITRFDKLMAV